MYKIKTFKDMQTFNNKVKFSCCWKDYFKIGGRVYKIYEYGGGYTGCKECYVYFYNKRSKTMIKIIYYLNPYQFLNFEVEDNPYLWRTDTL